MKKPLIVLTGPTAVGKTALSIALAKQLGCEIISADSMQIYKYMDIGSAKIMPQEMEGVPHYLVDVLKPEEEFHVVRFQQMAKEAMESVDLDPEEMLGTDVPPEEKPERAETPRSAEDEGVEEAAEETSQSAENAQEPET